MVWRESDWDFFSFLLLFPCLIGWGGEVQSGEIGMKGVD